MTANLLSRMSSDEAAKVLETSFAQFQADKAVVGLARKVRKTEATIKHMKSCTVIRETSPNTPRCGGDLGYAEAETRTKSRNKQRDIVESLTALKIGDVVTMPAKRVGGRAVIIAPMSNKDGVSRLPTVLTEQGKVWHLRPHEVTEPVASQGRVRVPKKFNHRQAGDRRQLLSILEVAVHDGRVDSEAHWESSRQQQGESTTVAELQAQMRHTPATTARIASFTPVGPTWRTNSSERTNLSSPASKDAPPIALVFDRVQDVLRGLGFEPEHSTMLRRIYGERDLLVALTIRAGLWDRLNEPELAAFASIFVFQSRRDTLTAHRAPSADLKAVCDESETIWRRLFHLEEQHALKTTDEPDRGLIKPMYRWTEGKTLSESLREAISRPETLSGGPSRASICSVRSLKSSTRRPRCACVALSKRFVAESSPTPEPQ